MTWEQSYLNTGELIFASPPATEWAIDYTSSVKQALCCQKNYHHLQWSCLSQKISQYSAVLQMFFQSMSRGVHRN